MEPVTHILTGAVLARTGLNRRAAYMTFGMAIAAEFPDIDILWGIRGPLAGFMHHRGITHTFAALPVEAALITGAFWLFHKARKKSTKAPPNWPWLFLGCLLALCSHILLDWTNNYGVRPFFPFNPHWYAGSFIFIFEPVLFAILVLALVIPALGGLIGGEIGSRRPAFRGRPSAILACAAIAALYTFRLNERNAALTLAAQNAPAGSTRFFASPHPLDPFTWSTVAETPEAYQLATVDTRRNTVAPPIPADTLPKPPTTLALLSAKRSELGRVYLDWSMFPVISEAPYQIDPRTPLVRVTFSDARFLYDTAFLRGRENPPISGFVTLDMHTSDAERVQETFFNGKEQKQPEP